MAPRVGEEEVVGAVLPASESLLASARPVGRRWEDHGQFPQP
jgi:hypothetical protein